MKRSADDRIFRFTTGIFAALVLLLVLGIGFELWRQSMLSIAKFGFKFWTGRVWDPVSGEFGALPFIWGTLYSSLLAMLISTPIALGIAIYISELSPKMLRQPLTYLTELLAAIPSIVYGLWGVFVLTPIVRKLEIMMPPTLRKIPIFSGPPLGVGMGTAAIILAVMVIKTFRWRSARGLMPSARRAGRRSRSQLATGKPESLARSCSDSAAHSARRWR